LSYRKVIYDNYVSLWTNHKGFSDETALREYGRVYEFYMKDLLPENKNAAILDVGCGGGKCLAWLATKGYVNLRGVDLSPEQVAVAKQAVSNVIIGDGIEFLTDRKNEFDLIIALDVIEHLTKEEVFELLYRCHEALRPGGRLIMQTPNAAAPMGPSIQFGDFTHEVGLTPSCLENLVRVVGFTDYRARECGPAPVATPAVLRLVLWRLIRCIFLLYDLIEVGGSRHPIYTRVFLAMAVRK